MNYNRNVTLDIVRAICAVWIIAIWHIGEYGFPPAQNLSMGEDITTAVLGIFVFLSSFFLQKYSIKSIENIRGFYLKRCIRLYIPFLVVSIIMELLFHWYESILQLMLSLIGFSFLYSPGVKTLWFVSILLFFYGLSPLILSFEEKWKRIFCSAVIITILVFTDYFHEIDSRMIYLCFIYCFGLSISNDTIIRFLKDKYALTISILLVIIYVLIYINMDIGESKVFRLPLVFSLLVLLYNLSNILSKNKMISNIFTRISYSSMMAYLLHRLIYIIFWHVCHEWAYSGWYFGLMIPVIFITSYYVQLIYDRYVEKKLNILFNL